MNLTDQTIISVIGLGYVGLPLALAFGKSIKTIGYDLKETLIENCKKHEDPTGEASKIDFENAIHFRPTTNPSEISKSNFIIIAVPTPIGEAHQPDLTPVIGATETVAKYMRQGSIVVFESTVYPGVTEEVCVPILEKISGMQWKEDFHVGYSPERINPGDKEHTLSTIVKVVSGDDADTLEKVASVYETIVSVGVHRTQTIKEAEAAKVIENTQRDLNIALMNELAVIFDRMDIDTKNVLEAAGSKWNFLPFRPGLVGGHCIGVDPYYLTYKAETIGYHPEVILAGRRINDGMGKFVAEKTVKMLVSTQKIQDAKVGLLGLTFKEDCPDLRNTRVVDIIKELESYHIDVVVHDPLADRNEATQYYGIQLRSWEDLTSLSAIIIAVPHKDYREMSIDQFKAILVPNGSIVDVKSILDPNEVEKHGIPFWRL